MMVNRSVQRVLELAEDIYIETIIPRESHPAIRSGFAGYPKNPRWTIRKHQAWKQGKQWRQALNQGTMVVENKRLVPAITPECQTPKPMSKEPNSSWRSPFKKFTFSLN